MTVTLLAFGPQGLANKKLPVSRARLDLQNFESGVMADAG